MKKLKVLVAAILVCNITFMVGCSGTGGKSEKANETVTSGEVSSNALTVEEKVEDFNYLYKTIEENYPFLDVNKRLNDVDWLSQKDEFLKVVKETETDEEFLNVLNGILEKLNNGHTQMIMSGDSVEFYRNTYTMTTDSWTNTILLPKLSDEKVLKRYGISTTNKETVEEEVQKEIATSTSGVIANDVVKGKVGHIVIPQMVLAEKMDNDIKVLDEYLESVKNHQALIIDIRGNGGGDTSYWSEYLLPKIISKKYSTNQYWFFKDGDIINEFLDVGRESDPSQIKSIENLDIKSLENLPNEISKDFKYYAKMNMEISPRRDSINFKGNIYLLVDKEVYSSAEALASFVKNTGLATIIGSTTGGDGMGTDPFLETLPNSGFVFRFPIVFGTDSTGVCNEEFKTTPDYETYNPYRSYGIDDIDISKVLEIEGLKVN